MTQWWSDSRKVAVEVEKMAPTHAANALAKLERGDYLDETGNAPSAVDHITLRSALERAIRGGDPGAAPEENPFQ